MSVTLTYRNIIQIHETMCEIQHSKVLNLFDFENYVKRRQYWWRLIKPQFCTLYDSSAYPIELYYMY